MMIFHMTAAEPDIPSGMSILVEGTEQKTGIPGFGDNRIPALFGVYRTAAGQFVRVWATSEPLLFNTASWNDDKAGDNRGRVNVSGESILYAFERNLDMKEELSGLRRWYYILEFDAMSPAVERLAFIEAYIRRADAFVSSARRYQDISLPAVLVTSGRLTGS